MGDETEDHSRIPEDESATSTDGGMSSSIPSGVLPRFESLDGQQGIDPDAIPRLEPPSEGKELDSPIIPTFEEPATRFNGILPTFDEPAPGAFPWGSETISSRARNAVTREVDDDFGISGPVYDEEMPLADHIEEMLKRLAIVVVVAGAVSLVVWPFTPDIINFLWYSVLPGGEVAQPRVYGPLEFLMTRIKVASLAGLVVALPVLVYETYAFMRPGLYRHERKYYLAAIPTSLVLAVVGVLFAYFIVLPALFTYFLVYSQEAGEIAFALARTFDLILILMGYLAIVFQIPLLIMLAIMMGLTTRRWLAAKRLYFWGAFLGLSFIASPDPTGMAPIIIALTMVALFEGTLGLLKWVGR